VGNHQVPATASLTERIHGVDAGGDVVTCSVYTHTRAGHAHPMFYTVQYRWDGPGRRIDRSTRVTNQFTGPGAATRLEAEMGEVRAAMAASRLAAARAAAAEVNGGSCLACAARMVKRGHVYLHHATGQVSCA
jgi:hypothetical protein